VARFNKKVTNRILGRLVPHLPGFGFVVHTGRKTHRQYRTPIKFFRRGGKYLFALTYGPNTDWVRNVLANGGCQLETRGRTVRLSRPRLFHDERRSSVPVYARIPLSMIDVSDFLELTRETRPQDRFAESETTPSAPHNAA